MTFPRPDTEVFFAKKFRTVFHYFHGTWLPSTFILDEARSSTFAERLYGVDAVKRGERPALNQLHLDRALAAYHFGQANGWMVSRFINVATLQNAAVYRCITRHSTYLPDGTPHVSRYAEHSADHVWRNSPNSRWQDHFCWGCFRRSTGEAACVVVQPYFRGEDRSTVDKWASEFGLQATFLPLSTSWYWPNVCYPIALTPLGGPDVQIPSTITAI